ncbi:putative gustatory receptor 94a, partial [Pseudolycoriella hygida]
REFGFDDSDDDMFSDMGLRSRMNRMGHPFDWGEQRKGRLEKQKGKAKVKESKEQLIESASKGNSLEVGDSLPDVVVQSHEENDTPASSVFIAFLIVYTHFSTVVVSGLYFYGSVLLAFDFYYLLNRKLKEILCEVEANGKGKTRMESYRKACNDIDKLSAVYSRIGLFMTRVNRVSAVQISCELLGGFLMITVALYYMFYALLSTKFTENSTKYAPWMDIILECLNGVIYSLIFCMEIHTITSITSTAIYEAAKLPRNIHHTLYINADEQFKRGMQELSLKLLSEKPEIMPLGLFVIDRSLITATVGTYLILLVQFQLDRKNFNILRG